MMSKALKSFRTLAAASLVALVSGAAAMAGQYIGGDLNLDLNDTDDVRIIAADVFASGQVSGDVMVFAADVEFSASVGQDFTAFAADITLNGEVAGDVELYGASVSVNRDIGGSLEVGAADISVASRVGGESELGGALITIEQAGHLAGGARVSGREIYVDGRISGDAELRGAEVHISGVIEGPLEVYARQVFIDERAVLTGPVTIRSPNAPEVGAGAQVGELEYIESRFNMDDVDFDRPAFEVDGFPGFWVVGGLFASSAFLLGVILAVLFPRSLGRMSDRFRSRPWVSSGLGLILYATFWLIMITLATLLVATVIGILLAPLVLLAMPIMYFLAFVFGGVVIGDMIFNRGGAQAGFLLRIISLGAVMLVITALHVVAPIGILIGLIVNCIGFGAWALAVFDRQKPGSDPVIDAAPAAT